MRLETTPGEVPPGRFRIYRSLVGEISRRVVSVEARHHKDGVFLANGGALWFDADQNQGGGLLEGATAECRGPRQLLLQQRAQDRLVREACAESPFRVAVLKNERDAFGHYNGSQENYQCEIASGWRLLAWRVGVAAMAPLVVLWAALLVSFITLALLYILVASVTLWVLGLSESRLSHWLLGAEWADPDNALWTPRWLETLAAWSTRAATAPISLSLLLLTRLVAFRPLRRHLTAFLASRCVLTGAGCVDDRGDFLLADAAPNLNAILGVGRFPGDRPLYSIANLFTTLYIDALRSPTDFFALFHRKQRLQICLGDSNMSETAEFLKFATTMLVIDAIEAGYCEAAPQLRKPLSAIRTFSRDETLERSSACRDGRDYTALELQRVYLGICERFVANADNAPTEARRALQLWRRTLDLLDRSRHTEDPPRELLGAVDWVTKRWLLRNASPSGWNATKKLDLRYAELSEDGYHAMLDAAGLTHRITCDDEVERAMRLPPPDSPATTRGRSIREFSGGRERVRANWRHVQVGEGPHKRVIPTQDLGGKRNRPRRKLKREPTEG